MVERLRRPSRLAALGCSALLAWSGVLAGTAPSGAADPAGSSPGNAGAAEEPDCGTALVTRTLSTGSAWRMCARIHPFKGLVLEDVQFRPATGEREHPGWMRVIGSLYLAQLNVPYDTGQAAFDDITDVGFGDGQLLTQTPETCDGDTLDVEQSFLRGLQLVERTIPGICVRETETGLGWHSQETWAETGDRYVQQGRALEVSSLSKAGWYEYQQRVTLTDQGTITVGLGAAGDLAPASSSSPPTPILAGHSGRRARRTTTATRPRTGTTRSTASTSPSTPTTAAGRSEWSSGTTSAIPNGPLVYGGPGRCAPRRSARRTTPRRPPGGGWSTRHR